MRSFFATDADLRRVFDEVETRAALVYTLAGMFDTPQLEARNHGASLSSFAEPASDSSVECPTYLVTPVDCPIRVRPVPQLDGRIRYAIDQVENPDSVALTHGGTHRSGALISGRIATASSAEISKRLQSLFSRAIGKKFVRVKSFWVGPEAMGQLERGQRLTFSVNAPKDYDLALDKQPL